MITKIKASAASFWTELKRRRVVRTTIAYVVGAWILVEAASVILPALLLPTWTVRVLVVLSMLGVPLVIVLAWTFDLERKPATGLSAVVTGSVSSDETDNDGRSTLPPSVTSAVASVAVIPFTNLSSDPEHQFVADGIATELHSSLARVHRLRVAARSSSFRFSSSDSDVKELASKLKVQFVISGSIQIVGDRMHLIVELDNAVDGVQIWSEIYDREMNDLFAVQQDIAYEVTSAFGGARLRDEIARAVARPTESLDAWSKVQRARFYILEFTPYALADAESLLRQAIALDADYAAAHATLASVLGERVLNGLSTDIESDRKQAIDAADNAFGRLPVDPFVLKMCGSVWAYFGKSETSLSALRRAVRIAPFDFGAWGYMGWALVESGASEDLEELHKIMNRILQATPQHPGICYWLFHRSVAFTCQQDHVRAKEYAQYSVDRNPRFPWGWMHYANTLGIAGSEEEARHAADRCMEISPALTPRHYAQMVRGMSTTGEVTDLRLAGLKKSKILP